jgi:Tol biopolymer transport system component
MRVRVGVLLVALGVAVVGLPVEPPASHADLDPAPGSILAPVGRQAGWLNLDAPRPRTLTNLPAPAYVSDLDALASVAALAVQEPLDGGGEVGGDILRLDLAGGSLTRLAERGSAAETLSGPVWRADGTAVLFQREDLTGTPVAYPGQATVRYPSRIEVVRADGSGRGVVLDDARQPAPSPDGNRLAFVRSIGGSTELLVGSMAGGDERELVPTGQFPDIAYPRFSPRGDLVAFMAAARFVGRAWLPLAPAVAYAHGLPWDLWLVGLDGSPPRLLAPLGGDDASLAWSPDGGQIFSYSGTGSAVVDVSTGEVATYTYLAGYGAVAWLPVEAP